MMRPVISLLQAGSAVQLPHYTEGPVADQSGNFYFTSLSGGMIYKMDAKGQVVEWAPATCPNGQIIVAGGDHLVCDPQRISISRFAADGRFLGDLLQGHCASTAIQSPNDLIVDSRGGLYFTDSVRHRGKVGYISAGGVEHIVANELDYPNGIALSKDEKLLFVAESYQNRILVFNLRTNGLADGNYNIFADLPRHGSGDVSKNLPDGLKVDAYGNVWVAHYGMGAVQILDSSGMLIQTVPTGLALTSNLCLCDDRLFVTGGYREPGPGAVLKFSLHYEAY
jgi:gluconolactonase